MRKGKAHGVFLRNSDGMDVILNNMSLTYRVIGGMYTLVWPQNQQEDNNILYHFCIIWWGEHFCGSREAWGRGGGGEVEQLGAGEGEGEGRGRKLSSLGQGRGGGEVEKLRAGEGEEVEKLRAGEGEEVEKLRAGEGGFLSRGGRGHFC